MQRTDGVIASQENNMLQVGEPAPDVTLPDQDGRDVALASLWQQQPTMLVFLRHFG